MKTAAAELAATTSSHGEAMRSAAPSAPTRGWRRDQTAARVAYEWWCRAGHGDGGADGAAGDWKLQVKPTRRRRRPSLAGREGRLMRPFINYDDLVLLELDYKRSAD